MNARRRRALSQPVGRSTRWGDEQLSALLAAAWSQGAASGDRLTHGFHPYPARMHPDIARALIDRLSAPGVTVLDPFCGSGTVLIEALVAGRRGVGVDLNPLSARLVEVHCALTDAELRARFVDRARAVCQASLARVSARRPARAPLGARQRAQFQPHVLLELAGLWEEITAVRDADLRRPLEVVLSAMIVKFSKRRADTAAEHVDKRLRKGLASEFFLDKASELCARWADLASAAGAAAFPVRFVEHDARSLSDVVEPESCDLILSSPPYGGTYDYHAHHAMRYPWLGLPAAAFERGEIGARRRLSAVAGGDKRWRRELASCLSALRTALHPSGRAVLLLGDAEVSGKRVDALAQVERLARDAGLWLRASASQSRSDYRGGRDRREHLLLLVPSSS